MKKIISILAFTVLPTIAYSQLPLVEYKPVIVGKSNNNSSNEHNRGNSNGYFPNVPSYSTPNRSTTQSYQTVGAYFFDASSQNFKRTKIKINLGESYSGETEIYVRAVLDRSLYRESYISMCVYLSHSKYTIFPILLILFKILSESFSLNHYYR